jgi:N-acyl-D-amino-acid deacylase
MKKERITNPVRTNRQHNKEYDILITGGIIYDGSGNPAREADVAIKGDMVVKIGTDLKQSMAKTVIDASECAISPGFIDPHSHTDIELLANPKAESKIRQGVTTEIGGNCGFSLFPPSEINRDYLKKKYDLELDWHDVNGFFAQLERRGIALNYGTLIGHSDLRGSVMGSADRPPTDDELKRMDRLMQDNLDAGVFGLSTGLIYTPGCFAKEEELIALCRRVAIYNGVYSTHMRDEGDHLLEAVDEAIRIAEQSHVSLHISHLKMAYPRNWPKVHAVLSKISEMEKKGMKILADRYPYIATSTLLSVFMPPWVKQGTIEEYLERLRNPDSYKKICEHVKKQEEKIESWNKIRVSSVLKEENRRFIGKTIHEAAREVGKDPAHFIIDLLYDEEDQVEMINFSLNEDNFKQIILHPLVVVASDGWALAPYGMLGNGKPHPRSYGTFPRMLGKYVREEGIMTLGEAIQKMTSITAKKFGLKWRGFLREGFYADIVIFDPDTVRDGSTWENPHQYPSGIHHVIVNGQIVIHEGEHTGALPGKILKKEIPIQLVH